MAERDPSHALVPLATCSPTARTLSGLFAGAPLVMMLVGAFVLRRYALDEREHARIQSRLLESRSARNSV